MKRKFSFLVVVAMLMTLFITPVHAVGPNLITNGDFENGKTDFTSEYTYLDPINTGSFTLGPEYMYTVGINPNLYHSSWASFGDHTSGIGKMMIVNGTYLNNVTQTVWSQDVTLQPTSPTDIVTSYDLFAGKTWLVGKVEVKTTNTQVCVKLVLNQATIDEHYLMTEVHIEIEDKLIDIPQSNGNPVPGKFDVNVALNPGQTVYEACFNNTLLTGSTYFIAAHAKVKRPEIGHEAPFCAVSSAATTDLLLGGDAVVAWGDPNPWDASMDENLNQFADWLWDAQYVTSAVADNGGLVDFVHNFNIIGTPTSATLKIAADNAFAYHINTGTETSANLAGGWRTQVALGNFDYPGVVIDPNTTGWHVVYSYDVLGNLHTGLNTLNVTGVNADWDTTDPMANPAAVIYKLCGTSYIVDHPARSESAWGGTTPFSGKNWAKYIEYTTTTPESFYRFTMFVRSTYPEAPAIIKVEVRGTEIGTAALTPDVNNWSKFEYDFQVPLGGSGIVKLTDFRLVASGDDFAIDDISLVRMP